MSVDRQIRRAFTSWALSTKASMGTSRPRSYIVKPAVSNMIFTRFFPMSWVSPCTTPITAGIGSSPSAASSFRCGFSTSSPLYMASEQSSRSVTKYSSCS